MGYTTAFSGSIKLSRKLTIAEARDWMKLTLDGGHDGPVEKLSYLQWVPTESLDALVWDGNEKFYHYDDLLKWILGWLKNIGVTGNGVLVWSGEEIGDTGQIFVHDSEVKIVKHETEAGPSGKPLTTRRLGEMALEQISKGSE